VFIVTVIVVAFHGVGGQAIFWQIVGTFRVVEPRAYGYELL
jgi:hypothetical protein